MSVRYLDLKGKGYIVSDLHLFSNRSHIKKYFNDIKSATREANYFILNGDIVDFIWTIYKDYDKTIDIAIKWFKNLIKGSKKCHFIYILGNHDCVSKWISALKDLSSKHSNFDWCEDYLISKKNIFFHGDLLLKPSPHLERKDYIEKPIIRGKVANFFYKTAINSKIHTTSAALIFPKGRCSKWIAKALNKEKSNKNLEIDVENVYFGHTHNAFEDHRHDDLRFFNTGSALVNSHLKLIEVK